MNCKPGDLAIVVRSRAGHEGKILRCIRLVPQPRGYVSGTYWLVDRALPGTFGGMEPIFPDECLRPLRDDPGTDETLLHRPVPVDYAHG